MEKRVEEPQFVVGIEFDDVSYPGNHARFFASLIAVDPVPPGFRWFLGSDQTEQVVRFIKRSDDYAAKRKRCLERSKTRASVDQLLSLENDERGTSFRQRSVMPYQLKRFKAQRFVPEIQRVMRYYSAKNTGCTERFNFVPGPFSGQIRAH
jgi:hypothetical protein